MEDDYFIVGGFYKDRNGIFEILEIDFKKDRIKAKYVSNNEEFIRTDLETIKRINDNVISDESSIWWVCHQVNLWNIDQRLIGFYRKAQFDILQERNIVIYYRMGEDKIKGVFKILFKRKSINPDFDDAGIEHPPIYQCRLELLSDKIICQEPSSETRFSFFDKWSSMRHGGFRTQVFPANNNDLELTVGKEIAYRIVNKI